MEKTSKWLKSFLKWKKQKENCPSDQNSTSRTENPTTPIQQTKPKEKKRWSFRRSKATPLDINSVQTSLVAELHEQKRHVLAVAAATAAAAQAASAVIRLTAAANEKSTREDIAVLQIQSHFRSYLARKALSALKGIVKLQALVRGHLVRKQAVATLRCMQALLTAQARARAQRIQMTEDPMIVNHRPSTHRQSVHENGFRHSNHEFERGLEENIKIVERDFGESKGGIKNRNSYSNYQHTEQTDYRFSKQYASNGEYSAQDDHHVLPTLSALTGMSPRAHSRHYEDYSFTTSQSNPHYYSSMSKPDPSKVPFAFLRSNYTETLSYGYTLYPSYMATTESSKAKTRSQSAPKSRPDSFERQPSRRRPSIEGRNVPKAVRMQRSSSHLGSTAQNYQYPWSIKLDKATVSLQESECGSTSTVLTNTNYCRSLVAHHDKHSKRSLASSRWASNKRKS